MDTSTCRRLSRPYFSTRTTAAGFHRSPKSTLTPEAKTLELIERDFGSFEKFREEFTKSAL